MKDEAGEKLEYTSVQSVLPTCCAVVEANVISDGGQRRLAGAQIAEPVPGYADRAAVLL